MGRRARLKQGVPQPLPSDETQVKRKTGFKRSGGKRKPIVQENGHADVKKPFKASKGKPSIEKGKARATDAEGGFQEVDSEEELALKAARECVSSLQSQCLCSHVDRAYFDPEDLVEGSDFSAGEEAGFDGFDQEEAFEGDLNDLPSGDEVPEYV